MSNIEIIGKKVYKLNANQGENYTLVFKVRNTGNHLQETNVYLRDYLPNSSNLFFYNEPGSHNHSNAKWIQFGPQKLFLSPNETHKITLRVNIPNADNLFGTFWCELAFREIDTNYAYYNRYLENNESRQTSVQIITNIGNTGNGIPEFGKTQVVNDKIRMN